MLDVLEFLAYLLAFWTFVFSPDFRRKWIDELKAAGAIGRCFMLLNGAVAAVCALAPIALLARG